ncbi:MAG: L,D-transpeptidase [Silvanigrellaceae bacterium]
MNPVMFSSRVLLGATSLLCTVSACSREMNVDATPQWLASPGMTDSEIQKALSATIALRVNLTSNRATLYKKGEALQQWNIASADVTGRYHNGQPKFTPEGIYGVEDFEHCPVWRPIDPVNPATGRVAQSEDERWHIFNTYPDVYGACGERNPLGRYVIWFQGPFGMHGNSAEDILRLRDPDDRRVSGGCLRNPNAKIKEIFHLALATYTEISDYKARVIAMENNPNKSTVSKTVRNLDMRIVVGSWNSDPRVSNPHGGGSLPPAPVSTPTPIPEPIGPAMICKAVAIDPARGIAPVHITLPATSENVSAWYRLNDPVRVQGRIPGTTFYRTGRGYIDKKFIGNCSEL